MQKVEGSKEWFTIGKTEKGLEVVHDPRLPVRA